MTPVGNREIQQVLTRGAGLKEEQVVGWGGGVILTPAQRPARTAHAYTTAACFPRDHAQPCHD